jgi:CIC family chloride channel protein
MGAVFAAAARAPLTALASVVEMTGDFTLTLPVMLAVAVATAVSRALSYGTIYTTKLLRRGTDIDQPAPWNALAGLTVADAMRPLAGPLSVATHVDGATDNSPESQAALPGPVTASREPQALFAGESLAQTLPQLVAYDGDGLPVLSSDGTQVQGWITGSNVITAVSRRIHEAQAQPHAPRAARVAAWAQPDPGGAVREPATPLPGYQVLEIAIQDNTPAAGASLGSLRWPPGYTPVSVRRHNQPASPDPGATLSPGDRIVVLVRKPGVRRPPAQQSAASGPPATESALPAATRGGSS